MKILTGPILEMLASLEKVLAQLNIDFYLVGAVARDIQFALKDEGIKARATEDIDIAVMVSDSGQYAELRDKLIASGDFTPHETEAIKLFYHQSIEIDLMPFGAIEDERREIRLTEPRSFVLNMPGFSEIFPHVEIIPLDSELQLRVCTLEGIVLLKLIAQNDRPQRTKDITDIEHIIANYFDISDEDIYANHYDLMDAYETKNIEYKPLICARVIGRKISMLLNDSDALYDRIEGILTKRPTTLWHAMLEGLQEQRKR